MVTTYNPFDYAGYFGPAILFALTIILLVEREGLVFLYIVCSFINYQINQILRKSIKEPRPAREHHIFPETDRKGARLYGMPSGHSQTAAFSAVFCSLANPSKWVYMATTTLWLITVIQRLTYKNHTLGQVVAGSAIGGLVGFFSFKFSDWLLKSRLFNKSIIDH